MQIIVLRSIVVVFVLFLVVFVSWREMVNPVFSGIAACFHVHTEKMNEVYGQALTMEDITARQELICTADVESVTSLRGCLREVKSWSMFGDMIVNDIPNLGLNTKKRINFAVRDHNRHCPNLPIAEERV